MTVDAINPRLNEVLQSNVGNKLTAELSAGIVGTIQQLMNSIAQEAFAAGQASEREKAAGAAAAARTFQPHLFTLAHFATYDGLLTSFWTASCMAFDLAPAHWGQGLMRQAVAAVLQWTFQQDQVDRVHAFARVDNRRSGRLLERSGFVREGGRWLYTCALESA